MQTGFNPLLITTRHPFNFTFLSLQNTHMTMICVSHKKNNNRGFALIATISVMVLLVMVALAMLSLATIEQRASKNGQAMAEAQANARLSLMIAIGELQKAAGPDQRVTATADLAAAADGAALNPGENPQNNLSLDGTEKGLSRVHPGTRYWTGVFTNRDTPDSIYRKTPAPRVEHWLVSGAWSPGPGLPPTLTPAYQDCLVHANGAVADPTKAAILVGANTVGKGAASLDQYVAAPLLPIEPGNDSGLRGSFAYWIGDEGVKARLNMERTVEDPQSYASLVAQRRGWETVAGFSDYPSPGGDADRQLPSLVTLPTVECLLPATQQGEPSPRQTIFHSATTDSRGLLVDTLNGGTRVDLTGILSNALPSSKPPGSYDNYPAKGLRVIPTTVAAGLRHLKWKHLQDFYKLHDGLSNGRLKVRSRTGPDTEAIAPIVFDFRILMGVRVENADKTNPQSTSYDVNPCGKIAVSIANPYSVPLEWGQDLEFEIKNQTPNGNQPSRIWQIGTCVYIPSGGGSNLDTPSSQGAVFNQAVFRIRPGRLEPGEARAYTQNSKVTRRRAVANQRLVVDMASFSGAAPFDFNNSVEMITGTKITLPRTLDVRESWQTTLVALEMRLGGSGNGHWLRRIEGFELDNGYFSPNNRRFTKENVKNETKGNPVPLMLYSFQISQPGMNYGTLMPAGYVLGQRASTLRTFADFNLRATNTPNPIASYNPPPYFMESNNSRAQLPFDGTTGPGFTRNLAISPLHWGHTSEAGSRHTVLFSIPRQFTSLAQFQHADLTGDDTGLSVGHQPGNAFGNSYATPFVKRGLTTQGRTDYVLYGAPNRSNAIRTPRNYYDISHLLNNALWDRYFFSTIPPSGESIPENPTLVLAPGKAQQDLSDPDRAAGALMIEGAFNINSTDPKAWKAFLASAKHFKHSADKEDASEAAFPRSLEQLSPHALPPTGEEEDSFSGYRRLTDLELEDLSQEIVKQIRRRGPFVSLAHFVNRALAGINDDNELTRSGALQFALDESGINISYDGSKNGFKEISSREDKVALQKKEGAPRADLDGGDRGGRPPSAESSHPDWATTSRDNNFGTVASILADQEMLAEGSSSSGSGLSLEQGYRSTGIPGWVTQADVLQVIGPVISARSDTFCIRARGDARDSAGRIIATSYCEAIVQRIPDFIDPANEPHDRTDQLTEPNKSFGRKFKIVSFRWLSPNEI
jgi:type II secretory pathway pseudopilin PulG